MNFVIELIFIHCPSPSGQVQQCYVVISQDFDTTEQRHCPLFSGTTNGTPHTWLFRLLSLFLLGMHHLSFKLLLLL